MDEQLTKNAAMIAACACGLLLARVLDGRIGAGWPKAARTSAITALTLFFFGAPALQGPTRMVAP